MSYTADDLLVEVRDIGSLSSTAATGTADADILRHADSELRDTLVPLMLECREDFYERVFDTAVTAGTAGYRINKRAALSRLNTVQWVGSDSLVRNLERLETKRIAELSLSTIAGTPWAYYLEGSRVMLHPNPNADGTLRVRAFVRPGRLTLTTDATNVLAVTAASVGASVTTLTTAAHGISVSAVRDVVASTPSFEHLVVDGTATVASSTTVTIPNSSFTSTPIVGDCLCVSDYSPMIQLPVELQPALFELTVARMLRGLGKGAEASIHSSEAERLVKIAIAALTPRVDTSERKLVGGPHWRKRRPGLLRSGP